jgi:hypothetical protein
MGKTAVAAVGKPFHHQIVNCPVRQKVKINSFGHTPILMKLFYLVHTKITLNNKPQNKV